MKIIFMGTPEPAAKCLRELLDAKEDIVAVVTQPDRPKGRGLKLSPSPVKEIALERKIEVLQPEKVKDTSFITKIRSLAPDIIVVVAYGKILPKDILDIPKNGAINVHASLLPKYRGAAPIQWAILNGEKETGISIFKLEEALDTGDIISQKKIDIAEDDTSRTLSDKLFDEGAGLLVDTVKMLKSGKVKMEQQNDKLASYAPTLKKEMGVIDWKQPAKKIYDKIRAFNPWPGAYTYYKEKTLKILRAEVMMQSGCNAGKIENVVKEIGFLVGACDGALLVHEVQPESGKRMSAYHFAIGHNMKPGETLPS